MAATGTWNNMWVFLCFFCNVVIYRNFFLYNNKDKLVTIKHRAKENLVSFGLISTLACMRNLLGGRPQRRQYTMNPQWGLVSTFGFGSNLLQWDFSLWACMHPWYIFWSWLWQASESGSCGRQSHEGKDNKCINNNTGRLVQTLGDEVRGEYLKGDKMKQHYKKSVP